MLLCWRNFSLPVIANHRRSSLCHRVEERRIHARLQRNKRTNCRPNCSTSHSDRINNTTLLKILKIFEGADFQNHIIYKYILGKILPHCSLKFSWKSFLDEAVVKNSKTLFLHNMHNSEGNHPPKHKGIRAIAIVTFTLSSRITMSIVKSVAGMATDLTISCPNIFIMIRSLCRPL